MTNTNPAGPDHRSPDLGDWRINIAIWITATNGVPVLTPLAAHQMSSYDTAGENHSFITPSATALHLNAAWRTAKEAARLREAVAWTTGPLQVGLSVHQITMGREGALFDFFEALVATAMSSYAAVEAFCNSTIIDKAPPSLTLKRRDGDEKLTPEDVERKVSTDEKLKRILPDLVGLPTPAGKLLWEKYIRLKNLRDAVTHFKRRDQARLAGNTHEPTALLQSWRTDPYALPETAMEVVRYFHPDPQTLPRWMSNPSWHRTEKQARS